MLKRQFRLRSRRDFDRVYKSHLAAHSDTLVIKVVLNRLSHSRIAVVMSTKAAKRAVVRNRNRRRIFAVLRECWRNFAAGYDIVIIIKQDLKQLTPIELNDLLIGQLKKLGLYKG